MTLLEALRRTLELLLSSRTSSWAGQDVEEIAHQLGDAIAAVESGRSVDPAHLKLMFAPTGALQETSIDNGWGDEFLSLSEVIDRFLDE
jgi:hypothetical protein